MKLLQTGVRHSQEPASRMRRLISNIEVEATPNDELVVESSFILAELAIQAKHDCTGGPGTRRIGCAASTANSA